MFSVDIFPHGTGKKQFKNPEILFVDNIRVVFFHNLEKESPSLENALESQFYFAGHITGGKPLLPPI